MPRPLWSLKHFAVPFFVVASGAIHFVYAQAPDVSSQCAVASSASQVTLSGLVSDPSGATLHDAFVTLSCGAAKLQATTDATGRYSFQLLPGTYNLTVAAKGFTTKEQSLDVSGSGNNLQDLILNVAQENSTIEV